MLRPPNGLMERLVESIELIILGRRQRTTGSLKMCALPTPSVTDTSVMVEGSELITKGKACFLMVDTMVGGVEVVGPFPHVLFITFRLVHGILHSINYPIVHGFQLLRGLSVP